MIKWLIRPFFARDIAAYVAEARAILEDAKKTTKKEYVAYERLEIGSASFIYAMQPVVTNAAVVSWLKQRQEKVYEIIKVGDQANVQNFIGRALAIDAMLKDLEDFGNQYKALLIEAEEAKRSGGAQ